jgi:ketosteroid isomerase-like protein
MSTTNKVMTTQEVADRFHQFAQKGQWTEAEQELYADDAVCIEPASAPGMQSVSGKNAIIEKGKQFSQMVEEMHGGYSNQPVVAGNHFAVAMGMDITMKGQGRSKMDEIAVYEVKDGKIAKSQFFY